MRNFLAWPFLISRNQHIDYRVIVAPDFLVQSGQSQLISRWTQNQDSHGIVINKTTHSTYGVLSIVFRQSPAKTKRNETFRDNVGRPILWIEGLVFNGDIEEHLVPTKILDEIRQKLEATYQEFWDNGERFNTVTSATIEISLPFSNTIEPVNLVTNKGFEWRSTTEKKQKNLLIAERKMVNQILIIGIIMSLLSLPLLFVTIGFITLPIGLWMTFAYYKKQVILDAQIKEYNK